VDVDRIRIHVPADVTDAEALDLIRDAFFSEDMGEHFEKALKNPLSAGEQKAARREFLSLQQDFGNELKAEMDGVLDRWQQLERAMQAAPGLAAEYMRPMVQKEDQRTYQRLRPLLRRSYGQAFRLGLRAAGADRALHGNEEEVLARLRRNEFQYAENFLTDVRHGEGTMDYGKRANLYVNALEEAYNLGMVYGDQSANVYYRWKTSKTETCPDCGYISGNVKGYLKQFKGAATRQEHEAALREAEAGRSMPIGGRWGNGVYSAQELAKLAVVPRSGSLTCTTQCGCRLIRVDRPTKAPGPGTAARFVSTHAKHFTGEGRQAEVERRTVYGKRAKRTETRHRARG
jgi:hypothetical protein